MCLAYHVFNGLRFRKFDAPLSISVLDRVSDMVIPEKWIPLRWPDSWTDPVLLDLLSGCPINCLLLGAAAPAVIREAAKSRNLTTVAWTNPEAAGIAIAPAGDALWKTKQPVIVIDSGAWPGVRVTARKSEDLEAGPTGVPWIDSNAWTVALARALAPDKSIWVSALPRTGRVLSAESYQLAVADAALRGGRWIVQFDEHLAAGLAKQNADAVKTWTKIKAALAFSEKHSAWSAYETDAPLGVVSDFVGENEFLAGEILNLSSRRNLLYRVIPCSHATAAAFRGLEAVLYVDPKPPGAPLAAAMRDFARQGGLVVSPAKAVPADSGTATLPSPVPGYVVKSYGKGRIAYPEPEWEDPFLIAAAVHNLASRRVDPVRLFNTSTAVWNYGRSPDTHCAVAQVVNYTDQAPSNPVTLAVQRKTTTAKLYTLEKPDPVPVPVVRRKYGVEFPLPPFTVWAAVEMEI